MYSGHTHAPHLPPPLPSGHSQGHRTLPEPDALSAPPAAEGLHPAARLSPGGGVPTEDGCLLRHRAEAQVLTGQRHLVTRSADSHSH